MNEKEVLGLKVRELVAIGASIAANCQPCLVIHIQAARREGATEAELAAAISVGETVKAKPSEHMREMYTNLLGAANSAADQQGCGCQPGG